MAKPWPRLQNSRVNGEATEAERLTSIKWAHLSGVNYNTIGDGGYILGKI